MSRPTPRLTDHARERCAEMGVSTKRAKRVVQHRDLTYPGRKGTDCWVSKSSVDPILAVVWSVADDGTPLIVTVIWSGDYDRERRPDVIEVPS